MLPVAAVLTTDAQRLRAFVADFVARGHADTVARGYGKRLERFFRFVGQRGRAPLETTAEDVRAYLAALRADRRRPNVLHAEAAALEAFFAFSVAQGWRDAVPAISLEDLGPSDAELLVSFARDRDLLGRSPETRDGQVRALRAFVRYLRDRDLAPLAAGREELRAYVDAMRDRGCCAGTIATHCAALHAFYTHLVRRGLVAAAPPLERPRLQKNPPTHVLSPRQVLRILAQPDIRTPLGVRDRTVLELLYSSAVRVGELVRLDVEDVDFGAGFLRIQRGKGGNPRVVPIGVAALDWLRRYLGEVRPVHALPSSERALFLSAHGRRLCKYSVQCQVRQYAGAARIPFRVSPHSFRHAAATHLLRGDGRERRASVLLVRDMLGHASTQPTTIYTRVEITDLERELGRRHFRDAADRRRRRRREPRHAR